MIYECNRWDKFTEVDNTATCVHIGNAGDFESMFRRMIDIANDRMNIGSCRQLLGVKMLAASYGRTHYIYSSISMENIFTKINTIQLGLRVPAGPINKSTVRSSWNVESDLKQITDIHSVADR